MIGALQAMKGFPLEEARIKQAIKEKVPEKALELNIKAFELGKDAVSGQTD